MAWAKKVPEDIGLVKAPGYENEELLEAFCKVAKALHEHPKSIVVELNTYRKNLPIILDAYLRQSEGLRKAVQQGKRMTNIGYDRGNKRWSADEDNELINCVCEGKMNIHEISAVFGRSPGAIKTHISDLVGRKRITQEVAGKFIGTIDGESINGDIKGTVFRE